MLPPSPSIYNAVGRTRFMNPHKAAVFWFSGLSGAGKSTISEGAAAWLSDKGFRACLFDGDAIRQQLHRDHGYHASHIIDNNRRIAELCVEERDKADAILVSVISPLEQGRQLAGSILGDRFYIVYCNADVQTVCRRDVKGLYAKAKHGEITDLIGFSEGGVRFEPPGGADIVLDTTAEPADVSIQRLCAFMERLLHNGPTSLPQPGATTPGAGP